MSYPGLARVLVGAMGNNGFWCYGVKVMMLQSNDYSVTEQQLFCRRHTTLTHTQPHTHTRTY
jgi:hypothetical protein